MERLQPAQDLDDLFAEDMLGDDLEEWMAESSLLRRSWPASTPCVAS